MLEELLEMLREAGIHYIGEVECECSPEEIQLALQRLASEDHSVATLMHDISTACLLNSKEANQ